MVLVGDMVIRLFMIWDNYKGSRRSEAEETGLGPARRSALERSHEGGGSATLRYDEEDGLRSSDGTDGVALGGWMCKKKRLQTAVSSLPVT